MPSPASAWSIWQWESPGLFAFFGMISGIVASMIPGIALIAIPAGDVPLSAFSLFYLGIFALSIAMPAAIFGAAVGAIGGLLLDRLLRTGFSDAAATVATTVAIGATVVSAPVTILTYMSVADPAVLFDESSLWIGAAVIGTTAVVAVIPAYLVTAQRVKVKRWGARSLP